MKILHICMAALVLALLSGSASWSQIYGDMETTYGDEVPSLNVHVGAAFLMGDTQDDTELIAGIEYAMPAEGLLGGAGGAITISVDYLPISQAGDTVSLFPVLVNYKKQNLLGEKYRIFGGLGAGIYYATDPITGMDLEDGVSFAWNVIAGVDLSRDLFFQARYIAGSNPGDDGMIATELGYRF